MNDINTQEPKRNKTPNLANLQLDYTLPLSERSKIVDHICSQNKDLSARLLDQLTNYLIEATIPKNSKERSILTPNRMVTINKRETSLESLQSAFSENPDGFYGIVNEDKQQILSPKISIIEKDLKLVPGLKEIQEEIKKLQALPQRNYIIQKAIIEFSKTQYILKESYYQPVRLHKNIHSHNLSTPDLTHSLDLTKELHIKNILKSYSSLKMDSDDKLGNDLKWLMIDFENLVDAALKEKPKLLDIVIWKVDCRTNKDIRELLLEKYGETFSIEYISHLFNKRIPSLIAKEGRLRYNNWYYTNIEKGRWKKCSRCGQVLLMNNDFFSYNTSSKDGFYSVCKSCRNTK